MSKKFQTFLNFLILINSYVHCQNLDISNVLNSGEDIPGNMIGGQFAWKCLTALSVGKVFHPNDHTTCVCTAVLKPKCRPNNKVTSTATIPPTIGPSSSDVSHPLDPLVPVEISRAKEIFETSRSSSDSKYIYNWITLQEPPKADLLEYFLKDIDPPRSAYQRKAFLILIEKGTGNVFEAVVNLDTEKVESFIAVPHGSEPARTPDDDTLANEIALSSPLVQERCRQLGYPNMSLVHGDPWIIGFVGDKPEYKDVKRGYNVYMLGRNFEYDNVFVHPLNFMVVVDIIQERVVAIEDLPNHDDYSRTNKYKVPSTPNNYDYKLRPSNFLRKNDKPIKTVAPDGPSYKVNGNSIEWQNFKMQIGFNGREGLVIHNILYEDNGIKRPVMYRASLGETGVSYSDPRPPFHRKMAMDEGEYGLGFRANEQIDQEHCIGKTHYIDVHVNNNTGDPKTIKNAICITEEDDGILWQHKDSETLRTVITRSHRLAISFIFTGENYDFIFRWLFYQDASIQFQVRLTGIVSTTSIAQDAVPGKYGTHRTQVFPQVDAPYHQHYYSLRLDTEIDGNQNSVFMSDVVPLEDENKNPYGNAFENKQTLLKTASEARTNTNAETGRVWVVANPNKTNEYSGKYIGWKLIPQVTPPLMIKKNSPLHPKVAFLDYDFWATKYQEGQLYSGGLYLNNSGLPEWVDNEPNASIENTDVVIWHSFRLAHVPRTEDFPVMPFEDISVWLRPYNFFLENPGLCVPPTEVNREKTEL